MSEQEIFAAAIAMAPPHRAALAQQLLATLDDDVDAAGSELHASWGPEIRARLEALQSGMVPVDGPEAMRLIREALAQVQAKQG